MLACLGNINIHFEILGVENLALSQYRLQQPNMNVTDVQLVCPLAVKILSVISEFLNRAF